MPTHSFSVLPRSRSARVIAAVCAAALLTALLSIAQRPGPTHAATLYGASGMAAAAATGRLSMYLEVAGVTPATPAADHSQDITLSKVSWGVTNSAVIGNGGAGAGKASFADFSVIKQLDNNTPLLLRLVAAGAHAQTADIFLVHTNPDGTQAEALQYDLSNVIVTGDTESTTAFGAAETVTLNAETIKVTYYLGTTAQNSFSWNQTKNATS